ncbi:MAG: hypothetical protein HS115_00795 [Spirochaetales bacterium]|nr:hypothetical protein [Spirochaetales bacterium]
MTRPTANKFYVEERAGGQVNASNLAGDLSVSAPTVIRWLDTFDRLYISWSIPPFTTRISRSLVRQRKYYLWDWSQVREDGPRFEKHGGRPLEESSRSLV